LKNFGINLYSDPLLMVAEDVVWFQGDIYLNKAHSLHHINYEASKFYLKLLHLEYDPFNPEIKLNIRL